MSEEVQKPEQPNEEKKTGRPDQKTIDEQIREHKRKNALIAYLAVMFAVAFLLVAVSMIVENHRLQGDSATLNGKIASLQDEFNELQKKSRAQEEQISSLEEELEGTKTVVTEQEASIGTLTGERDELAAANETLTAELGELTEAKDALTEENESLRTEKQELDQRAGDLEKVYDLLIRAQAADEAGDYEQLAELLEQIEPLKDLLSEDAAALYETLVID